MSLFHPLSARAAFAAAVLPVLLPALLPAMPPARLRPKDNLLPAALCGGAALLLACDEEFNELHQARRSRFGDDLSRNLRFFGAPPTYLGVSGGLLAAGLAAGEPAVRAAGLRVCASVLATGMLTRGLKYGVGRRRPLNDEGSLSFDAFSDETSFPSGHTAMAFALATALSAEIDRGWASAGLYTLATGTAWSRLNDNRHWLSDIAAGALLGWGSAKLVQRIWGRDRGHAADTAPDERGDGDEAGKGADGGGASKAAGGPGLLLGPEGVGFSWNLVF